ncbi:MAG: TadE/TadG family type IV pilus assembly protein [Pseudomonadota bacterium]
MPAIFSRARARNALSRCVFQDRHGNVAMITALSAIPIIGVVGLAIDFQSAVTNKLKVQVILDSAVIHGSRALQNGAGKGEVRTIVQDFFAAHLAVNGGVASCPTPTVRFREDYPEDEQAEVGQYDIRAEVTCDQPTTLTAILGHESIAYSASSGSTYGIGKVDVAFVFDSSGSMRGQRLADLKAAAETAVDELLPEAGDEDVRLAMTTYSSLLNAGEFFDEVVETTTYEEAGRRFWTASPGPDDVCDRTRTRRGVTQHRCRTVEDVELPHTCVWERGGDQAFTPAPPGPGAWIEAGDEKVEARECPETTPLPLTNDKQALLSYVDALGADGRTAGHIGTAWGWYLLAPEWTEIWPEGSAPMPYDEPDSAKALVLMTDGAFNNRFFKSQGSSDAQARAVCDAIKANSNIRIYSVAFQAPRSGERVLEYCASGPEFFFDPSNGDELEQAYQSIASSISDLRINR